MRVLARLLLVLYGLTLIVSNTLGFKERAGADWVLWATAGGVLAILGFAVSFKRPATGLFCGIVVAAGLGTWMFLRFLETRCPTARSSPSASSCSSFCSSEWCHERKPRNDRQRYALSDSS